MEIDSGKVLSMFDGLYDEGENVVNALEKINTNGDNEELTRLIREFKEGQEEMKNYLNKLKEKYNK